ncbi:MAG: UDP-N-acetylmuramoyl-tripeptide--D-alanyl-D-alanine ligase [Planctomycetaceae bacterium]|nr:UDP-N-acetylmuramoyl-tripeptide--D-alanyl-D-alanine ligase [Planctomycetaceae bacterium]
MNPVALAQLVSAVDGQAVGVDSLRTVRRVEIDSRRIESGDVFWAVRGERLDGHDYVADAMKNGAAVCVVSSERAERISGPKIVVRDTLTALADFAHWYRNQQSATVIGVTGSVGKTTTRRMIHTVLGASLPGVESPENFNNHFGLPLSLLGIEKGDRYAVMELGASHVGEIRDLAAIARPHIGVVTAVELAHVSTFGSLDHITIAKGELPEALPADGLAVLAGDDARVRGMSARTRARVVCVGEGPENQIRPTWVKSIPGRLSFRLDGRDYSLAGTGRHVLVSALAAVAVAREFGVPAADVARGFEAYRPMPGRGVIRRFGAVTVIDDTYNANPGSMRAAIHILRDWAGPGRCIFVAGDMLELGTYSAGCHRQLGEEAVACGIHGIIALGHFAGDVVEGARLSGHRDGQLRACTTLADVTATLEDWLQPGDVVLVKGSRGMRMERVVEWLEDAWGIKPKEKETPRLRASA